MDKQVQSHYIEKTDGSSHHDEVAKGGVASAYNPLSHLTRDELLDDVERFARDKGLEEHLPALRKGALVAQNPLAVDSLPDLDDADRAILRQEREHKWKHPPMLYITIFLCSIGAATQGWDQTGSNGANLSFPSEFGIANNEWIIGLVNGAPYLASAALGCWLSDPLNNWFGRRGVIFITACCLIATPIGSAFTHSWQTLFVCRLVLGLGMGAKGSTVPVFAAENSPAAIRGALTMTWQLWTAFGIFAGTVANLIVKEWRLQLGSAMIPAIPLLGIWLCPESPRWLIKKGRYPQAYRSLRRLRYTDLQAARDLYYISVQVEEERKIVKADSFFRRATELFVIPRVRRATLAAFTVMIAQQMCGINIIAFYSSTVFVEGGLTNNDALKASVGFGALNWLFAFPALYLIDSFGRRSLLLTTFPAMAVSLLIAGFGFIIPKENKAHLGLIAAFIYVFAICYSVGEGPVPFAYSAEVFPLAHREVGMAFAVATCLGFAFVLSLTFPRMLVVMGGTGAFCFYAGLNVLAFIMIFFFMPETKGATLEELDYVFNVPTPTFMRYQLSEALPYFIKRRVFMNKNATLRPLALVGREHALDEEKVNAKRFSTQT